MALSKIPINTTSAPYQTFTVVLEDKTYEITLQYNERDDSWYITLGLPNLSPIFKTKVTNGVDILRKYRAYEDVPKGSMFVVDNMKDFGRLTRDSFDSARFDLLYADESTRLIIQEL